MDSFHPILIEGIDFESFTFEKIRKRIVKMIA